MTSHVSLSLRCPSIRVLLVDDQAAVRNGLSRLLACADPPVREVRSAATPAEALAIAAQMRPHIVVLDVDLNGEDGLALISHFTPKAAAIVLTCHGDDATRARAFWLGAQAFIEKHSPSSVLLESIAAIGHIQMRGEEALTPPGGFSSSQLASGSDAPLDRNP